LSASPSQAGTAGESAVAHERTQRLNGAVADPSAPDSHGWSDGAQATTPEAGPSRSGRSRPVGVFGNTRLRLVVAVFVLLAFAGLAEVVIVGAAGSRNLLARIEHALEQEIDEVSRLLEDGRDPATGQAFASVDRALDLALVRNVPSNQEAFLTFVDGDLHGSAMDRYPHATFPPEVVAEWAAFSVADGASAARQASGTFDEHGVEAHWAAVRTEMNGQVGAFVVVIDPEMEQEQVVTLQRGLRNVSLFVLAITTVVAWFIAGAVLRPVRELTETARSISSPRRTERLEPMGSAEAVEMARTFNAMLDRIEVYSDSQLEFLRAAGHELRTPLNVVTGHLEVLGGEEDLRRTLPVVLDELHRMGQIVREIESLAAAVRSDFLTPRPVDLAELTDQLFVKLTGLGPRVWLVDECAHGMVVADRYRLTEAVLNLADNALAHTEDDEEIAIGSQLVGTHEYELWIRDSGVGIPLDEQQRIFERFVRGGVSRLRYRGAGLGLAVARAIAEAHGGDIRVESRPREGARFILRLPREPTP
jgi:two-component system, OmpR family, sensor kinase